MWQEVVQTRSRPTSIWNSQTFARNPKAEQTWWPACLPFTLPVSQAASIPGNWELTEGHKAACHTWELFLARYHINPSSQKVGRSLRASMNPLASMLFYGFLGVLGDPRASVRWTWAPESAVWETRSSLPFFGWHSLSDPREELWSFPTKEMPSFIESFESRPHNSFVEKSVCISWEKCFVKTYSNVFSEIKYLKSKNRVFFF